MAWLSASADPLGAFMPDHLFALRLPTPAELHLSGDRIAFMRFLSDDDALRVLAAFETRSVTFVGLKPSPSLGLLVRPSQLIDVDHLQLLTLCSVAPSIASDTSVPTRPAHAYTSRPRRTRPPLHPLAWSRAQPLRLLRLPLLRTSLTAATPPRWIRWTGPQCRRSATECWMSCSLISARSAPCPCGSPCRSPCDRYSLMRRCRGPHKTLLKCTRTFEVSCGLTLLETCTRASAAGCTAPAPQWALWRSSLLRG